MITNIRSTPKPSQNGTNFQALLPTIGDVETFKDRLKPCPLPGGGHNTVVHLLHQHLYFRLII